MVTNNFPTLKFKKLFHVGTLNSKNKGYNSLEGEGLSVSICPDEWQQITPLSGHLYSLTRNNNCFLDFHMLSEDQKNIIYEWGLENNYIEKCKIYKVLYYSCDLDMEVVSSFVSYEEAIEEAYDEENIIVEKGYKATGQLIKRTLNNCEPILCLDLLSTIYVEDILCYDGVYWDDDLDVSILSAPRGVINISNLKNWRIKEEIL